MKDNECATSDIQWQVQV